MGRRAAVQNQGQRALRYAAEFVSQSRGGADDEEDQKGAYSGMLMNCALARSNFSRERKCVLSRHTKPRMQT
jgi:hypothetical protein